MLASGYVVELISLPCIRHLLVLVLREGQELPVTAQCGIPIDVSLVVLGIANVAFPSSPVEHISAVNSTLPVGLSL